MISPARKKAPAIGANSIGVFGKTRFLPQEVLWIPIAVVVMVNLASTIVTYGDIVSALVEASPFIFLIIGYWPVRGIIAHTSQKEVRDFLEVITWVNSIAAILYVLHQGLHIPVYTFYQEFQSFSFQGELITRTFWFMPQLLLFSFAFQIAKPRLDLRSSIIIVINALGIFITYTRSLVIAAAAIIALVIILRLLKKQLAQTGRTAIVVIGGGLLLGLGITQVFPVEMQYFSSRIQPANAAESIGGTDSLIGRLDLFNQTSEVVGTSSTAGLGFPNERQLPITYYVKQWYADMVWIMVLFRTGIIGIAAFLGLFILFWLRTLRMYLQGSGETEFLGLVFALLIPAVLISSVVSFEFLYLEHCTLGLWYLAVVAAEINRANATGKTHQQLQFT